MTYWLVVMQVKCDAFFIGRKNFAWEILGVRKAVAFQYISMLDVSKHVLINTADSGM